MFLLFSLPCKYLTLLQRMHYFSNLPYLQLVRHAERPHLRHWIFSFGSIFSFCNFSKSLFIVNIEQVLWNLICGHSISLIQAARAISFSFFLILAAFSIVSSALQLLKRATFLPFQHMCNVRSTLPLLIASIFHYFVSCAWNNKRFAAI